VVLVEIAEGAHRGRGESVPYGRYGETIAGSMAEIESLRGDLEAGLGRRELERAMKPGAARNAIDCALWDLEAKQSGRSAAELAGVPPLQPVTTAYTLSLDTVDNMRIGRC
jgi:L-alanine-DL-glutamate epimerase-like enolase superfamily enzyme